MPIRTVDKVIQKFKNFGVITAKEYEPDLTEEQKVIILKDEKLTEW